MMVSGYIGGGDKKGKHVPTGTTVHSILFTLESSLCVCVFFFSRFLLGVDEDAGCFRLASKYY